MTRQGETGDDERSEEAQGATSRDAQATGNDRDPSSGTAPRSADHVHAEAASDEDRRRSVSVITETSDGAGRVRVVGGQVGRDVALAEAVLAAQRVVDGAEHAVLQVHLRRRIEDTIAMIDSLEFMGGINTRARELRPLLVELLVQVDVADAGRSRDAGGGDVGELVHLHLAKLKPREQSADAPLEPRLVEMRLVAALARDALLASSENFRDEVAMAIANVLGEPVAVDGEEIEGEAAMARLDEVKRMSAGRSSPAVGWIRKLGPREQSAGAQSALADRTDSARASRARDERTGVVGLLPLLRLRAVHVEMIATTNEAMDHLHVLRVVADAPDQSPLALAIGAGLAVLRLRDMVLLSSEAERELASYADSCGGTGGDPRLGQAIDALLEWLGGRREAGLPGAGELSPREQDAGGAADRDVPGFRAREMADVHAERELEEIRSTSATEGGSDLESSQLRGRIRDAIARSFIRGVDTVTSARENGSRDGWRRWITSTRSRRQEAGSELGSREQDAREACFRDGVTFVASLRAIASRLEDGRYGTRGAARALRLMADRSTDDPPSRRVASDHLDDVMLAIEDYGFKSQDWGVAVHQLDRGEVESTGEFDGAVDEAYGRLRDLVSGLWRALLDARERGIVSSPVDSTRESGSRGPEKMTLVDLATTAREQSAGTQGDEGEDQASMDLDKKSLPVLRVVHVEMQASTDSAMCALHALRSASEARDQTPLSLAIGAGLAMLRLRGQLTLSADAERELVEYADACGATGGDVELGAAIDVLLVWLGVRGPGGGGEASGAKRGGGSTRESGSRDGKYKSRSRDAGSATASRVQLLTELARRCRRTHRHMLADELEAGLCGVRPSARRRFHMSEWYLRDVELGRSDVLDAIALGGRIEVAKALRWLVAEDSTLEIGLRDEACQIVADDFARGSGSRESVLPLSDDSGARLAEAVVAANRVVEDGDTSAFQSWHREVIAEEIDVLDTRELCGADIGEGSRSYRRGLVALLEMLDVKLNPREQSAGLAGDGEVTLDISDSTRESELNPRERSAGLADVDSVSPRDSDQERRNLNPHERSAESSSSSAIDQHVGATSTRENGSRDRLVDGDGEVTVDISDSTRESESCELNPRERSAGDRRAADSARLDALNRYVEDDAAGLVDSLRYLEDARRSSSGHDSTRESESRDNERHWIPVLDEHARGGIIRGAVARVATMFGDGLATASDLDSRGRSVVDARPTASRDNQSPRRGTGMSTSGESRTLEPHHLSALQGYVEQWLMSVTAPPDLRLRAAAILCGLRQLRGGAVVDMEAVVVLRSLAGRDFLSGAVGGLLGAIGRDESSARVSGTRDAGSSLCSSSEDVDPSEEIGRVDSGALADAIVAAERVVGGSLSSLDHCHRKTIDASISMLELRSVRCRSDAESAQRDWLRLARLLSRVDTKLGQPSGPVPMGQISEPALGSTSQSAGLAVGITGERLDAEAESSTRSVLASLGIPDRVADAAVHWVAEHGDSIRALDWARSVVAMMGSSGGRLPRSVSTDELCRREQGAGHQGRVTQPSPARADGGNARVDVSSRTERMAERLDLSIRRARSTAEFLEALDRSVDFSPEHHRVLRSLIGFVSPGLASAETNADDHPRESGSRVARSLLNLDPCEQDAGGGAADLGATSPREAGSRDASMLDDRLSPREQDAGATGYSGPGIELRALLALSTERTGGIELTPFDGATEDQLAGRIPPGERARIRVTPQLDRGYRHVRLVVHPGSSRFLVRLARVGMRSIVNYGDGARFVRAPDLADSASNRWVELEEPITSAVEVEIIAENAGDEPCGFSAVLQLGEPARESSVIVSADAGLPVDGLPVRVIRDAGLEVDRALSATFSSRRVPRGRWMQMPMSEIRGSRTVSAARESGSDERSGRQEPNPREQGAGAAGIEDDLSRESRSRGCENMRALEDSTRESGSRDLVKTSGSPTPVQTSGRTASGGFARSMLSAIVDWCWRLGHLGAIRGLAIADALQAVDGFPSNYPARSHFDEKSGLGRTREILLAMAGLSPATEFEREVAITARERDVIRSLISAADAASCPGDASSSARENGSREQCCDVALVPLCAQCGKRPAECFGLYEGGSGDAVPSYACGSCCAHGNEDGRCRPLSGEDWQLAHASPSWG